MGGIYLKYWLYDQVIKNNIDDSNIKKFFQGLRNHIEPKIKVKYDNYVKINNLTLSEMKSIKKLYALYTIFYGNANNSDSCIGDQCKYIDYFGEGLDEFINSINRCSSDLSTGNYCKEFKEFIDICKDKDLNAGISIYDEQTQSTADTKEKYLLSVEKYQNKPLYIYLKDEKLLNFVKTSHFIRTKNSATIAVTSVVGSAIGLSSIFYYLYKFTPFGNTLRKVKGKNIVNMDEEQNDLLYTSHTEQIPFKNRKYNVAYQNFSDT
ncbi:Plasmodium vivax Vir protein, putative [Plasmodium vivax]|uniref:Vir protein, putative n=1 Tax=Plasmodium vivax TaxID=5855 RepID=A0A1G4EBV4_PLAVI|nr:Plasmodium vivax Vir protein, putative [Plasmodium vivax]